jgi:hypothetical protein
LAPLQISTELLVSDATAGDAFAAIDAQCGD